MSKQWVCFYSQTGSEINNIRKLLGVNPDIIVFNGNDLSNTNKELLESIEDRIVKIPARPTLEDYIKTAEMFDKNCIITLHGYLRIIPEYLCSRFRILNLHPGLITVYPELKGFNPQEKAFKLKLPKSGVVIHEVIPEVDSGKVITSKEISIKDLSLDEVYAQLHDLATEAWVDVLRAELK